MPLIFLLFLLPLSSFTDGFKDDGMKVPKVIAIKKITNMSQATVPNSRRWCVTILKHKSCHLLRLMKMVLQVIIQIVIT